jgi:hypothetical protein
MLRLQSHRRDGRQRRQPTPCPRQHLLAPGCRGGGTSRSCFRAPGRRGAAARAGHDGRARGRGRHDRLPDAAPTRSTGRPPYQRGGLFLLDPSARRTGSVREAERATRRSALESTGSGGRELRTVPPELTESPALPQVRNPGPRPASPQTGPASPTRSGDGWEGSSTTPASETAERVWAGLARCDVLPPVWSAPTIASDTDRLRPAGDAMTDARSAWPSARRSAPTSLVSTSAQDAEADAPGRSTRASRDHGHFWSVEANSATARHTAPPPAGRSSPGATATRALARSARPDEDDSAKARRRPPVRSASLSCGNSSSRAASWDATAPSSVDTKFA